MNRMQISKNAGRLAAAGVCVLFAVGGCGGVESRSSQASAPIETQVDGEIFSSLDVSSDHLSGVFVKDGQPLAFDIDRRNGVAALRLSTESGQVLYSVVRNSDSTIDLQVGDYHATLPAPSSPGVSPVAPTAHPAPFRSSGDLKASLAALDETAIDRLPYLSAALGRVGLDGATTPIAAPLHLIAMRLTQALKLPLNPAVAATTNGLVSANLASKQAGGASAGAPAAGAPQTPGSLTPEALAGPTPPVLNCPHGRAPCPSGYIASVPLGGCCEPLPPAPPPTFYGTAACVSGAARQVFTSLESDPCVDDCLGMCGPGCSPWLWVCGDTAVHAACWNHDSAYCPETIDDLPNLEYPVCETEYLAYTTVIGLDTVPLGSACDNTPATDFESAPPFGLWTIVPTFYVQYRSFPQLQNPGAGNYYGSSILPGWDSWAHGPAQGGDHATTSGNALFAFMEDTNFYDSVVFHSDSGFLASPLSSTAPGQWWAADLGASKNIQAITIYNRTDYQNYPNGLLDNFQILIWNGSTWVAIADESMFTVAVDTSAYDYPPGPSRTVQTFTPGAGTNAEWVAIEKTDDNNLVMADVGIWAY
jgi:hypothetical protein